VCLWEKVEEQATGRFKRQTGVERNFRKKQVQATEKKLEEMNAPL
jgi:hypothetical protein